MRGDGENSPIKFLYPDRVGLKGVLVISVYQRKSVADLYCSFSLSASALAGA